MKGYVIPNGNHVVRYCRRRYVNQRSGEPDTDAFRLDRSRENSLSANWAEYFDYCMVLDTRQQREQVLVKVRDMMHYDPERHGRFAFFGVDELMRAVEAGGGEDSFVEHDPTPADPGRGRGPDLSHALAYGFPDDDYYVGVLLKALATSDPDLKLFPGVA